MAGFVAMLRAGGPLAEEDLAALDRAAAVLGHGSVATATAARLDRSDLLVRGDAGGALDASDRGGGTVSLSRPADGAAVYWARTPRGVVVSTRVAALLASGLVPRVLYGPGVAGLLWRGAAIDRQLPVAGVRAVPAGSRVILSAEGAREEPLAAAGAGLAQVGFRDSLTARAVDAPGGVLTRGGLASLALLAAFRVSGRHDLEAFTMRWPHASPESLREAARAARALGTKHHDLEARDADPVKVIERHVASLDLPSADGLATLLLREAIEAAHLPRVAAATGGRELFAVGRDFRDLSRTRPRLAAKSRRRHDGPDPFEVAAHREIERRVYVRVPVNAAHARWALLPAATREALLRVGPRPADGVVPGDGSRTWIASEVAFDALLPDRALRDDGAWTFPYVHADVASAARRLPSSVRFGRPGSGGELAKWVRQSGGWPAPKVPDGFEATLDSWLRGPLGPWLDATLSRDRVAARGVFDPDAVTTAVSRWRRMGEGGWTARPVAQLALTQAWLDREGLARSPA